MNTFVLAIAALGLVAFLILSRRRRAAAGSAPAERGPSRPSRRRRRRGADHAPLSPVAATAETAATRSPSPAAFETPPLERIAPPIPDWTPHDEMIVEPGWPLPGEISGSWTTEAAVAASPIAVEEPPAGPPEAEAEPEPDPVDLAEEWTMPAAAYAETEAEPRAFPAEPAFPGGSDAADAAMEAWVPGVSEADPIAVVEPEPEPPADPEPLPEPEALPEPQAPWAEAEAEITATEAPPLWVAEPVTGDQDEGSHEPAGPPLWTPVEIPALDEPVASPVEAFEDLSPISVEEPVWEPPPAAGEPAPAVDLDELSRELAELLPRAVTGPRPLVGVSDALGVTPRMLVVLHALAERPGSLPQQARRMGVSRPVVADICARLEQLGLVRRERDEADRRRTLVVVTDRGRRLAVETTTTPDAARMGPALERLSPAERGALASALRTLAEDTDRPS